MEEQNDKVAWPEKATEEVMPLIAPTEPLGKKERKLEFVYADITGVWYHSPEDYEGPKGKHTEPGQVGMRIVWGAKNFGFGEYYVRFMTDGKISVHDEFGGPDFSRQLFAYLGEQIAAKGEHDRERDAREKKAMDELEKEANEGSGTTQGE